MANISSTIKLTDRMTSPLLSITNALTKTVDMFEEMQNKMDKDFDVSRFDEIRDSLESANVAIESVGNGIEENVNHQKNFNKEIQDGNSKIDTMVNKAQNLVTALGGLAILNKAKLWLQECMNAANTQNNVENQLKVVLNNVGALEGSFDKIKQKATQIQGKTIFGDEAMIGGAAELSTYIKDTNAIMSMMDTLSNYASGMSGGAEVSTQQMVDYATQLGKVLNGTYDGITKKGFELSDAQKKIIENGTDMEKALVVQDVINESWDNLAETMAKTPQGILTQTNNELGDMSEILGNSVMPYVAEFKRIFVDAIGPAISWIADNMSWLAPIFITLAIAIGAVTVALTIYKAVAWLTAGANWAMLAPILIIIAAIALIVAGIFLVVKMINKATGASISAVGVIMGLLYTLAASIYNQFIVPTWNMIARFINFFANVWSHPISATKVAFLDLATTVIGYIETMAKAIENIINKIPGVKVNITGGLTSFKNKLETKSQKIKNESEWKEVVGSLDYWQYSDAYNAGYNKGSSIDNSISSMKNLLTADNLGMNGANDLLNDIANDTGSISNSLDVTSEELKYLRDIAEQEAINRYTTAEIKIDMTNNNNISSEMDIDGVVSSLAEKLQITSKELARGV